MGLFFITCVVVAGISALASSPGRSASCTPGVLGAWGAGVFGALMALGVPGRCALGLYSDASVCARVGMCVCVYSSRRRPWASCTSLASCVALGFRDAVCVSDLYWSSPIHIVRVCVFIHHGGGRGPLVRVCACVCVCVCVCVCLSVSSPSRNSLDKTNLARKASKAKIERERETERGYAALTWTLYSSPSLSYILLAICPQPPLISNNPIVSSFAMRALRRSRVCVLLSIHSISDTHTHTHTHTKRLTAASVMNKHTLYVPITEPPENGPSHDGTGRQPRRDPNDMYWQDQ